MTQFLETAFLPEATNMAAVIFIGSPWGVLACWLAVINVVTFLIFGLDKWKAKRKAHHEATRRVPEKTLFLLSAIGGSIGALIGMKAFHHKTLHKSFRFGVPAILILQIVVTAGLTLYFHTFAH